MLRIIVPSKEQFDDEAEEFIYTKECPLQLEHSLVSLSKWEEKWHKSFLGTPQKTSEETLDYIRCMTLTQNVDPEVYNRITPPIIEEIVAYINDPKTATCFYEQDNKGKGSRETITAELIYYWIISLNIPVEFQKWHLNKLITLIKVCSIKNNPPKKLGRKELMNRNRSLNESRKKAMNTRG